MSLQLNELSPAAGAKKPARRVGRGIGSGFGKTGGRGVKGQKSRSGSSIPAGFEGGQMPLFKRVPKFGFYSRKGKHTFEVRLSELNKIEGDVVSLATLKAANIVRHDAKVAKLILSGAVDKAYTIEGLRITKGAQSAIEAAGGSIKA